jgi:hypothetical protein
VGLKIRPVRTLLAIASSLLWVSAFSASGSDEPFEVQVIPSTGRTVTAELTDLDGDGRVDVLQAVVFDMPPSERRIFRVYLQQSDGTIREEPDLEVEIPASAATYDFANIDGAAGDEVLLLQPRGLGIFSFSRAPDGRLVARLREVRIPDDLTMAAASDERGLDRTVIASFDFGPSPWLIVPGIGETFFLSPDGALHARIQVGARANYFIQPPGPMLTESDIQMFLDAPRISIGDIDGDGRPDMMASSRHELRLFFGRVDGSFGPSADQRIALERVSLEDHIRGSGAVRCVARDIDGDGLLDLLVSVTEGGLMNASANSYVYFNGGSGWNLDTPDVSFEGADTVSADQLIDLDGDGQLEIVRMGIKISILELVEIFVQRALDAWLLAYRLAPTPAGSPPPEAAPKPMITKKFAVKLDFETSRTAGFVPTIDYDVNGDGFVDYLGAADGTKIEVYLGSRDAGFRNAVIQEVPSEGRIRGGDLNADELPDFILFNTRRLDEPLRLITNLGTLPGTPKRTTIEVLDD